MSQYEEEEDEEEERDAYVFVASGNSDTLQKLMGLKDRDQVRQVVPLLSGSYGALAFVRAGSLPELGEKLAIIRDEINPPPTDIAIAVKTGPYGPTRWSPKPPYRAYSRIRVEPGRTNEVMDAIEKYIDQDRCGSAVVAGSFDVLLELGGDSFEQLIDDLVARVQTLPYIVWTDSALAHIKE